MMMLIEDGFEFEYIIRHLGWVYEYIIRNFGRGERVINTDLHI